MAGSINPEGAINAIRSILKSVPPAVIAYDEAADRRSWAAMRALFEEAFRR